MNHADFEDSCFDDEQEPERDPEQEDAPEQEHEAKPMPPSAESLSNLLTLVLVGAKTTEQVGRNVMILAAVVHHPHAPRTVRELAARMGCSPSEAHRRGTRFREELERFMRNVREGGTK